MLAVAVPREGSRVADWSQVAGRTGVAGWVAGETEECLT